ncbi:unnamed protein product [Kluyveromyces dobzhanskii CBS 2104]|uniref:WGS project CCBQ000000000 data, contig 00016 n=1 Tax=Kluyveromyces dobzhanskii CBS 2104 TaxID=1427455 RepID=A0A0A8KZW1_9SACH|nr:unnamed protein product [Kluyveromyces dobzhanskii CBS 2104]
MRFAPKLILALCALFTFTSFILVIVATAGSTSNYSPINKIYVGEIDISHIKVEKLLPQAGPVLAILAAAMKAPNASYPQIFDALKVISNSAALRPLMNVLSYSNNSDQTLEALQVLAPAALEGNSSSTAELTAVYNLLDDSTDTDDTIRGLSSLVIISAEAAKQNASVAQLIQKQQTQVMELLEGSDNVTATVTSLVSLDSMSTQEKQQLTPVFTLFNDSTSLNSTLSAVSTLMTANVTSEQVTQLFTALSESTDITETLQQLQQSSSGSQQRVIGALVTLLSASSNSTQDLMIVQNLYQNNITSSASAKEAFADLTTMIAASDDPSDVLTTVAGLANTSSTTATASLTALEQVITAANNDTLVMATIAGLQTSLSNSTAEKQEQMTALFSLLQSSTNPTGSFEALNELTAIAQSSPTVFTPILGLLQAAGASQEEVTEEVIDSIMPDILQYLGIAERFRLGIFSYCRVDSNSSVLSCSRTHAVQGLDMKEMLYTELENSDFRPYLQALNISKEDIVLVGKLPDREHEYKPAIRAVLALNLLTIICSFILLIAIVLLIVNMLTGRITRWFPRVLAMAIALFSFLGAIIAVVVNQIIKSGTAADGYNVVHRGDTTYYGLVWTAFALAFITMILLWLVKNRKREDAAATEAAAGEVAATDAVTHGSSSVFVSENEKQDVSLVSPATREADVEAHPVVVSDKI